MILVVGIILVIAGFGIITFSVFVASAPDDEQRRQEDEDQMEYLKRWRETHENKSN